MSLEMKTFRTYSRSLYLKEISMSNHENHVLASHQRIHLVQALGICIIQLL